MSSLQGSLAKTLKDVRPTAFLGVPRVWEKMQESMVAVARTQWFYKRWIAEWAKYIGLQGNLALMNGYIASSVLVFLLCIIFNCNNKLCFPFFMLLWMTIALDGLANGQHWGQI